jgi:acyl-CoA thioester hydrolase
MFNVAAMPDLTRPHRPFAYTCDFDPMPFEVDFTGYMSNTVVVRWMEILRVRMMKTHFSDVDTGGKEHLSVITRTEIDYVDAIRYGELINGTAWVEDIARARWRIRFDFHNKSNRNLVIRARQDGTFLSPDSFRPTRVPELIRERFLTLTAALA